MVLPSKILGRLSNIFVWLGTITFFVMLVALPVYAHRNGRTNSARQMFTSSYNQTHWDSDALVFLMTFMVPLWCISGYDSTGRSIE